MFFKSVSVLKTRGYIGYIGLEHEQRNNNNEPLQIDVTKRWMRRRKRADVCLSGKDYAEDRLALGKQPLIFHLNLKLTLAELERSFCLRKLINNRFSSWSSGIRRIKSY